MGCQSSTLQTNVDADSTEVTKPKVVSQYDGTYRFDAKTYKDAQLKNKDSLFKKMKPEDVDRMMRIFKPFTIDVQGNDVMATFSHDVIKGKITPLSKSSKETKLFMTPLDEEKKDQTVTLIIRGNEMIVDPGKKEVDKMFFRRVGE